VKHPWWNNGGLCYRQITGWAWGDSLCITQWPKKTFLTWPNWIEHICFILPFLSVYNETLFAGLVAGASVAFMEHAMRTLRYLPAAAKVRREGKSRWSTLLVAIGAGSIMSAQEVTRVIALVRRMSLYSLCRRMDWFDGLKPRIALDTKLGSFISFATHLGVTLLVFRWFPSRKEIEEGLDFCE
jgi:hypothetical protein